MCVVVRSIIVVTVSFVSAPVVLFSSVVVVELVAWFVGLWCVVLVLLSFVGTFFSPVPCLLLFVCRLVVLLVSVKYDVICVLVVLFFFRRLFFSGFLLGR